jgi:hypothetical protein
MATDQLRVKLSLVDASPAVTAIRGKKQSGQPASAMWDSTYKYEWKSYRQEFFPTNAKNT